MLKRKDLIMKKPEQLVEILMEYSKDKKGEIADLTYAAAIQIRVLNERNNEKADKLYKLDSKLDEVKEQICDSYCSHPMESMSGEELEHYCVECPLNKLKVE